MFLVIVGENGCWLAGFGVIYSANEELPLVVVKTQFYVLLKYIFSMGFSKHQAHKDMRNILFSSL